MAAGDIAGGIDPQWWSWTPEDILAAVDARPEKWAKVPGYRNYEWSDKGGFRAAGDGQPRAIGRNNSGYLTCKPVSDRRRQQVTVGIAPMVLLAHHPAFRGLTQFPAGLETRHNPVMVEALGGPLCNAYPEAIQPGTRPENDADRYAALAAAGRSANGGRLPPPKPDPRLCIICGKPAATGGRRCHDCVVKIGVEAARLMRGGKRLEEANDEIGYGNALYLHALAVKYGGWGKSPVTLRSRFARVVRRGIITERDQ